MWSQTPDVPERQVFQTFADRRRDQTRRRIGFLVFIVVLVVAVWIARPHFPGAEAKVRQSIGRVLHRGK
jgi:hypothetical protein